MSIDYAENMFEAMKIIADKQVNQVKNTSFDQTIVATIVDASKAKDGIYTVFNGNTNFVAYSSETGYKKDDSVMVTIPQGDYNNQKIIISKTVNKDNDEDSPLIYHSPFENFVDLSGNLISNTQIDKIGLLANGNNYVWNENTEFLNALNTNNPKSPFAIMGQGKEIELNTGYTHIAVKAEFSTSLGIYDIVKGNFGLALVVSFTKPIKLSNDNKQVFLLDSSSFFGNVYGSTIPHTQEILFDISEYEGNPIEQINLYAYQRNNFKDINNNRLVYSTSNFHNEANNIFIKDCYVGLGVMNDEIVADIAKLYITESELYSQNNDIKNIYLSWIHKNLEDNSASLIYNDNFPEGYIIKWYKYVLGHPSPDNFAGPNWEEINSGTAMNISFSPNPNNQRELIKVIIIKDDSKIAVSPALELFNSKKIIDPDIVNLLDVQSDALGIRIDDDGEQGNYFLYNKAGKLIGNKSEKILTAVFDPNESVLEYKGQLKEYSFIKWSFPADGMIVPLYNNQIIDKDFFKDAQTNNEGVLVRQIDQRGNKIITEAGYDEDKKIIYISSNIDISIKNNTTIKYKLKDNLLYPGTRNYIYLEVEKDGAKYTASTSMLFNTFGTSGSDYTIVIDWGQSGPVFDIKDQSLVGNIRLIDCNGQNVTLKKNTHFVASWYQNTSTGLQYFINQGDGTIEISKSDTNPVSMADLYILKISYCFFDNNNSEENKDNYKLEAYFPIALKNNLVNCSFEGPDTIRYSADGVVNFYNIPYKLMKSNDEMSDLTWSIITENSNVSLDGLPKLKENLLLPSSIYFANLPICGVQCKNDNGDVLWTQPIYIYRDNYPSTTLNKWGGDIQLNNNEGTILAKGLAAGKKNSNNTFSGVVLGDWSPTDSDSSMTINTGIYGFHEGSISYAFKDDGEAFIGKDGAGRIEFNGKEGIIKSATFKSPDNNNPGTGMKIDLSKGSLELYSPIQQQESNISYQLKLSSIGTETQPFIQVGRRIDGIKASRDILFNQYDDAYEQLRNLVINTYSDLNVVDEKYKDLKYIYEAYKDIGVIGNDTDFEYCIINKDLHHGVFSNLIILIYKLITQETTVNFNGGGVVGNDTGHGIIPLFSEYRCNKFLNKEYQWLKQLYSLESDDLQKQEKINNLISEFTEKYIKKYNIPETITIGNGEEGNEIKRNYSVEIKENDNEEEENGNKEKKIYFFEFQDDDNFIEDVKANKPGFYLYNFEYKFKDSVGNITTGIVQKPYEKFRFKKINSIEEGSTTITSYILRFFMLFDTSSSLRVGNGIQDIALKDNNLKIEANKFYDIILQESKNNKNNTVSYTLEATLTDENLFFGGYLLKNKLEQEYKNILNTYKYVTVSSIGLRLL